MDAALTDPSDPSERRLRQVLADSPLVWEVLTLLAGVKTPSLWLGAGAICDTVWNAAHGFTPAHAITDLDIVYFDPSMTLDDDAAMVAQVTGLVGYLGVWADVKNEANVHVWYPSKFGAVIPPYTSLDDAIATWPTTAGAIAVQLDGDRLAVKAPFGLEDLFGLIVRANRVQAARAWYEHKCARWRAEWPRLTILGWEDGVGEREIRLDQVGHPTGGGVTADVPGRRPARGGAVPARPLPCRRSDRRP